MAFDNGVLAVGQFGFGVFFVVETERDVFVLGVRAVADVALVGEDGADVSIKFDNLSSRERREGRSESNEETQQGQPIHY